MTFRMEMKQKWKERRRKHECNRSNQKQKKYPEVSGSAVIPQEDLDLILEAAMMAPSARNTRPWEFVVVETGDPGKIPGYPAIPG